MTSLYNRDFVHTSLAYHWTRVIINILLNWITIRSWNTSYKLQFMEVKNSDEIEPTTEILILITFLLFCFFLCDRKNWLPIRFWVYIICSVLNIRFSIIYVVLTHWTDLCVTVYDLICFDPIAVLAPLLMSLLLDYQSAPFWKWLILFWCASPQFFSQIVQ